MKFLLSSAVALAVLLMATGVAAAQQTEICSSVSTLHIPQQQNGGELLIIKTSPPGTCERRPLGSTAFDIIFEVDRVAKRMLAEYYRDHPELLSKVKDRLPNGDAKTDRLQMSTPAPGLTVVVKGQKD